MLTFQDLIARLCDFWAKQGCIIHEGYDLEVGAGTFNPATFLRCLGPEPYNAAYVEPSRRPADGRYGENPNRVQLFHQFQVVLKPSPPHVQELYLQSLEAVGFKLKEHDIRFVHDDWESPTIGAWGLGWEVWSDGMEITQFTYFQAIGGVTLRPITVELTYGLERLAMYLQNVDNIFDVRWNDQLTIGDISRRTEIEWSRYNFEASDSKMWQRHFNDYESEAKRLIVDGLALPAYDFVCKASHAFNMLDARGVISVSERAGYIARVRTLACLIAEAYLKSREELNFPLLKNSLERSLKAVPLPSTAIADPEKTDDFLLEIGSEELPATFVPMGMRHLENAVRSLLTDGSVGFSSIHVYGTPRRLAIYVRDLKAGKPASEAVKKGPALPAAFDGSGAITPAGLGFLRGAGYEETTLDQIRKGSVKGLEIQYVKDKEYLFATQKSAAVATIALLAEKLPALILGLDFPKKMRWGDLEVTYARPLHWIVALYGKEIIPFAVADVVSGRESSGHRQLAPNNFAIARAQDYLSTLKEHKVMVDVAERTEAIVSGLDKIEKETGGVIVARERVLPQVVHLVEWPMPTTAQFDAHFLKAPKEVLISEMVEHQKYFPIANKDGSLKNSFAIIANNTPSETIRAGNRRVLSARLSDGVFLYEQDLRTELEAFNQKLKNITFQQGVGSVFNKVERIVANVALLRRWLPLSDGSIAARAALLCKADLASELVKEFPELQGTVGRCYAEVQGEEPEVSQAIEEHWMPRSEHAPLPKSGAGTLVSLADKFDNLICCFSLGLKPTSSSDPHALRRQVLGIVKTLIQGCHPLPLREALEACYDHFLKVQGKSHFPDKKTLVEELLAFITQRVKTVFQDYGLLPDEIEASLATGCIDIYDTYCKVKALHNFRQADPKFKLLHEVYKRAKGQITHETPQPFDTALLAEEAEISLNKVLSAMNGHFQAALEAHHYDQAYTLIAQVQPALAMLFDKVLILHEDPHLRRNRIALLQRVFGLFEKLLDFGKLQG